MERVLRGVLVRSLTFTKDVYKRQAHALRLLLFYGLGTAAAGNLMVAFFIIKGRKEKILCWEWAAVFAALLLAHWAFTRGYFNFEWLKQMLLWLQKRF